MVHHNHFQDKKFGKHVPGSFQLNLTRKLETECATPGHNTRVQSEQGLCVYTDKSLVKVTLKDTQYMESLGGFRCTVTYRCTVDVHISMYSNIMLMF